MTDGCRAFNALIQAEGATTAQARNKILRVLAEAELDGNITRFEVSLKEATEPN